MKQTVKKYKSHIAALAVIALVLVVPMGAAALADGMNDMVGGYHTTIFSPDEQTDFVSNIAPVDGVNNLAYAAPAVLMHKISSGTSAFDKQSVFYAKSLGQSNNELILTMADVSQSETRSQELYFMLNFDVQSWIESGSDSVELTLASARDVQLRLIDGVYEEASSGGHTPNKALNFVGIKGSSVRMVSIPSTVTIDNATHGYVSGSSSYLNVTKDGVTAFIVPTVPADMLRASVFLADCDRVALTVCVRNSGSTDALSFKASDAVSFDIDVKSSPVNGYSVANIFMGLTGCCMLVGAVFATPFVDLNDVRSTGKKVKNKYSKKGRR